MDPALDVPVLPVECTTASGFRIDLSLPREAGKKLSEDLMMGFCYADWSNM